MLIPDPLYLPSLPRYILELLMPMCTLHEPPVDQTMLRGQKEMSLHHRAYAVYPMAWPEVVAARRTP